MIKNWVVCFIVLMSGVLTGNAQQKMTPLEFNDKLASITDTLYSLGTAWGTKFNEVYPSKKFSELEPCRKKLEQFLKEKVTLVTGMKDVADSKELRLGMIRFLQFEQGMIVTGFLPIERLSAGSTDAQVRAALDHVKALSEKEAVELEKFGKLQEAYATKNGFTIEAAKDK